MNIDEARELSRLEEYERREDIYYPDGGGQSDAYYEALKRLGAVRVLRDCAATSAIARRMLEELAAEGEDVS
jgi:hypothetical protein